MGNTSSAAQRADFMQRDDRRFQEIAHQGTQNNLNYGDARSNLSAFNLATPQRTDTVRRRSGLTGIFRREPSIQSPGERSLQFYPSPIHSSSEEQEERPLMTMEDSVMTDAPQGYRSGPSRTLSNATLSRQASTMSRLGSRLLPDAIARDLLRSGEETPAEGRAHQLGRSAPELGRPSALERRVPRQEANRFSFRESLRPRSISRAGLRRQPVHGALTGHQATRNLDNQEADDEDRPSMSTDRSEMSLGSWRRRARLTRVRDSMSLRNIFGSSTVQSRPDQGPRAPSGRPPRVTFADESDHLLPPVPHAESRVEVDEAPHELDAIEPETRNILSSSRTTLPSGGARRFPHGLRSRSTRLIRRGEHPPLSQVLQLAAQAIAAQLSGQTQPSLSGTGSGSGEVFDGSIQNFVQTLQEAATAQAGANLGGDMANGNLPPVNFLRVFQFPNNDTGSGRFGSEPSGDDDEMNTEGSNEESDPDRSVTLVLVGVRSMPASGDGMSDENGNLGPSLDTLLSLPFLPPTNILRNGSSGALFRRSEGRSGFAARRNSMTNFSSFPSQYESQRHERTRSAASRSPLDQTLLNPPLSTGPVLSESPPGPNPPPSTPADPRSGAATPDRRPSSSSAAHSNQLPELAENPPQSTVSNQQNLPFSVARQRRRSDSEYARRPELSSGASRRNGIVEPDSPPAAAGRSWLIYVVGTNVSPDHPAFTMPSLFTDNPTYEDMQLLSTLLGPAKPPVATQDDITSAGGLYRISTRDGVLLAEPLTDSVNPLVSTPLSITLVSGDRCLICLCDYEASEEVRQLSKCQHVYHRECIDEWLTTGRNSCPMCRSQGVEKMASGTRSPLQSQQSSTSAPGPAGAE